MKSHFSGGYACIGLECEEQFENKTQFSEKIRKREKDRKRRDYRLLTIKTSCDNSNNL